MFQQEANGILKEGIEGILSKGTFCRGVGKAKGTNKGCRRIQDLLQGSSNSGDKRRELLPELRRAVTEAEGEACAQRVPWTAQREG